MPRRRRKSNKPKLLVVLIILIGIILLTGFNPLSPQPAPTPVVVVIPPGAGLNIQLGFTPAYITLVIGVNNTVIWKNEDTTWHTAHSNIPEFDSRMIAPGASFTHTFLHGGSFPYHCDPHPWMTGLIIVAGTPPLYAQQPNPLASPSHIMQLMARACDVT
jgi:hypothetical protein